MSSRSTAFQYAKGLFNVAVDIGDLRQVARELVSFSEQVDSHDQLRQALTSPVIPPDRKQAVVSDLLTLTPVAPLVGRFLLVLARNDHLGLLPAVAEEFDARLMEHLKIDRAEVTTAVPVDEGVRDQIAGSLSAATGREVRVTTRVDPSIVGGVVARVGSLVFDGSVLRQLERLREQMASGA
jgi:F-type H+-transporting ATPase subunit delta